MAKGSNQPATTVNAPPGLRGFVLLVVVVDVTARIVERAASLGIESSNLPAAERDHESRWLASLPLDCRGRLVSLARSQCLHVRAQPLTEFGVAIIDGAGRRRRWRWPGRAAAGSASATAGRNFRRPSGTGPAGRKTWSVMFLFIVPRPLLPADKRGPVGAPDRLAGDGVGLVGKLIFGQ